MTGIARWIGVRGWSLSALSLMLLASPLGCSGDGGAETATTRQAVENGTEREEIQLSFELPVDAQLNKVVLGALSPLTITDRVQIGGDVFTTTGDTTLGVEANVASTFVNGTLTLRDRARVQGNAIAKLVSAPPSSIGGPTTLKNPMPSPVTVAWKVSAEKTSHGDVPLEVDQRSDLAPGRYGKLTLKSRAIATLHSGVYRISEFSAEPQSKLLIDDSRGPVQIVVDGNFMHRGAISAADNGVPELLFAVRGTSVLVEAPFTGVIVAPQATVQLQAARPRGHRAFIVGKSLLLEADTKVQKLPFDWTTVVGGGACTSAADCLAGHSCAGGTCQSCGNASCLGQPCSSAGNCAAGLICASGQCQESCADHPSAPDCVESSCENGVLDGQETDVDCGSDCAPCTNGERCTVSNDCGSGLECGTNNGAYFGKARGTAVCWPVACQDGVDASECGSANSLCGANCGGVIECDPATSASGCPAGEVCKEGLGSLFDVDATGVCVDPSCPSADPAKCGAVDALCGSQCVCTPSCSGATAANPSDGCGGECPHLCALGEACCSLDVHCPEGATCQAQTSGPGICRPAGCAFQVLAPPLCGSPSAPCGAECPVCTPECDGRQCGSDLACGTSCGSCGTGQLCTAEGQCVTPAQDPPIHILSAGGGQSPLPDLPEGPTTPVGSVAGEFSISEQGTAQYDIPIEVPPGRAGIEPVLSLHYSGTRGTAETGIGWKLAGLSEITRCPRLYALDGYSAPIKNDHTDRFCIDGKPLEAVTGSAPYGSEGAEYRTLIDTFAKIVSHREPGPGLQHPPVAGVTQAPASEQGPDYFEVRLKDGRILTYGRSRDALVMGRDGVRTAWLLARTEDRAGNFIVYRYQNLRASLPAEIAERAPNVVQPKAIFYTGHGSVEGNREVRFDYEHKHDGSVTFAQGGVPQILDYRLSRISTFVRGKPVKNYRLDYESPQVSLLTRVRECAHDTDVCKQPTEFTYQRESGFNRGPAFADLDIGAGGQLDVNGDGVPDFLVTTVMVGGVPASHWLTAASIAADVGVGAASYVYLTPVGGIAANLVWSLVRGPIFGAFAEKPEVTFTRDVIFGSSDRLHPTRTVHNITGLPCPQGTAYLADYDQDGKDDVISACSPQEIYVLRSIGDGNFAKFPTDSPVTSLPRFTPSPVGRWTPAGPALPAPLLYDINGDGLQDLVSCYSPTTLEVRLRLRPELGFAPALALNSIAATGSGGPEALPFCDGGIPTHRILDLDGDGTPELLTHHLRQGLASSSAVYPSGWYALRYQRSLNNSTMYWEPIDFPNVGLSSSGQGMQLADVNGDALNDVVRLRDGTASFWLNTGRGFLARTLPRPRPVLSFAPQAKMHHLALADHDADGRLDFIEHWRTADTTANVALHPDGISRSIDGDLISDLNFINGLAGSFTTSGDLDGDGNLDLFGSSGAIYYGTGLRNMLLTSVTDGLGNITRVNYDLNDPYKATCNEARRWPEQCLRSMKGLVSSHTEGFKDVSGFQGEIIERTYNYAYENARMNVTGHGWLGFDKRTVSESTDGVSRTVTTEFSRATRYTPAGAPLADDDFGTPYLYPLAGLVRKVTFDQAPQLGAPASAIEDAPHARRTVVTNTWVVRLSRSARPFPSLQSAGTETFSRRAPAALGEVVPFEEDGELRTSCRQQTNVDDFGNVRYDRRHCEAPESEARLDELIVETEFSQNTHDWLISNPELITTTSRRFYNQQPLEQTQLVDPEYNHLGQLRVVTRDPGGNSQRRTYGRDDYGNITTITESTPHDESVAPRITEVGYDVDGVFPTWTKNALQHQTSFSYNESFGQLATVVDPNSIWSQQSFDAFGRVTRTLTASSQTHIDYSSLPRQPRPTAAGVTYPRTQVEVEVLGNDHSFGGRSVTDVDHRGRTVRTVGVGFNGAEVTADQVFDLRGRVAGVTLPSTDATSAPFTEYSYDYLDRPIRVEHSDGNFEETHYASGVHLAASKSHWLNNLECRASNNARCGVDIELHVGTRAAGDAIGQQGVVIRDHLGLIARTIDGENLADTAHSSNFRYGPFNRLMQLRDNGGTITTFAHDPYGRVTFEVDPNEGTTQYFYNGFGELERSVSTGSEERAFQYDDLGRLRTIEDAQGVSTWIYDPGPGALGRLSETISPGTAENPAGNRVVYDYDPTLLITKRGQLRSVTHIIEGISYSVGMHYDDLQRLTQIDYPNTGGGPPIKARLSYDVQGPSLESVSEVGSVPRPIWKLDQAFQGQLAQQATFGNGAISTFSYEPDRYRFSGVTTTLGNNTIQDLGYTHYPNGQVLERIAPDRTQEFTYDPLGRVASYRDFGVGLSSSPHEFHYDVHGNLTQNDTVTSTFPEAPHLPETVGNNVYGHTHGRLTSRQGPDIPGGLQTFVYTPFDLPKQIVTGTATPRLTQFEYTADEQRVVRRDVNTSTRHFVGGLYQRLLSAASGATIEERFSIPGGSGIAAEIVRTAAGDKTLYFHGDHQGTPETISDSDGGSLHQAFDTFGDLIGSSPPLNGDPTRVGYTGHQQDNDLRLIDMGGRIYDPLGARFTTADPVMQAPYLPGQGQNRYAYVFNDPINFTDPSGFVANDNANGMALAGGGLGAAFGATTLANLIHFAGPKGGAWGGAASVIGVGVNLTQTILANPFGPKSGYSFTASAPSAAPNSNMAKASSLAATNQVGGLGPPGVQERSPESYAAGPKNAVPCPKKGCDPWLPLEFVGVPGSVVTPGAKAGAGILSRLFGWFFGRGAAEAAGTLSQVAKYGIQPYNALTKALKGTGLQAHHLIEQRFAGVMGLNTKQMASIAVTPAEHQAFTNAWRALIPYGEAGTGAATRESVTQAARQVYANYPQILGALGL